MKWFKHDADANNDARLLKVQIKYGMEGYGLYWYCLELIAHGVDEGNITFELEHDSEVIAHKTGIHHERVQEMMTFMVRLGLFENSRGVITCMRMAKRLDQSMTSNPQMRKLIKRARENHDEIMTESCPDKTRLDKTRLDTRGARKRAPQDFALTEKQIQWAANLGFSIDEIELQTETFKDHEFKSARKDWSAVWRNWMRRALEYRNEKTQRDQDSNFGNKLNSLRRKAGLE